MVSEPSTEIYTVSISIRFHCMSGIVHIVLGAVVMLLGFGVLIAKLLLGILYSFNLIPLIISASFAWYAFIDE